MLVITTSPTKYTPYTGIQDVNGVYFELHQQWLRYMNSNPEITVFFITLTRNIDKEYIIEGNTMWIKGTESFTPGIYEKTVRAMRICSELFQYDYIIRTNISTFWIFDRLLKFLENAPKEDYIASGHLMDLFGFISPHGSNMILSKDVATRFIYEYNAPEKTKYADDVMMGVLCKRFGLKSVKGYPWAVVPGRMNKDQFLKFIETIGDDVFVVRNAIKIPAARFECEAINYGLLIDKFYA